MKIVIPDDYQDMVDQLDCFALIRHHEVTRYRAPARDLDELLERLRDADVVVSIRERVEFSRALLERLPRLKLIALVGRNSQMIDFPACTALGIPVATGKSNSPVAPAELTLALIVASRRNIALEAERMKRGEWPCTLSHRLRGLDARHIRARRHRPAGRRGRTRPGHGGPGLGPGEFAQERPRRRLRGRREQRRAVRALRRAVACMCG